MNYHAVSKKVYIGMALAVLFAISIAAFPFRALAVTVNDTFTGTTIDASKWSEVDSSGAGGTTGNVQQNGTLNMVGIGSWGTNYVNTVTNFDRSVGGLRMDVDVTVANCSALNFGVGFGDPTVLAGSGESYVVYYNTNLFIARTNANSVIENVSTGFVCTNNVPFHLKILVGTTTGASVTVDNGSAFSVTGGTFNTKGFFLSQIGTGQVTFDNFSANPVAPGAPTGLTADSSTGEMILSWTAPADNGGVAITDYVIEYKLAADASWTTFVDGTSTFATTSVTGLTSGQSYNFRVSATNVIGTGTTSGTATAVTTPYYYVNVSDSFTGTTIDTNKWVETDPGGTGGTVGNIQQNGTLSLSATGWGTNHLASKYFYDRTTSPLKMDVDVTLSTCSGSSVIPGFGYGDPGVVTGGGQSYTVYYYLGELYISRQIANTSAETVATGFACTNNVPFHVKLVIGTTTGASVYINNATSPAASVSGGTFNNKGFFLTGLAGASVYDNYALTNTTGPNIPTDLVATPGNAQVGLSWTAPGDNGSPLTDYIIEYKLASAGSWTTFPDGTSTATSTTVTGLTNGRSYNFRVSAVNGSGTSGVSSTATAMPISPTPTAPTATSLTVTGFTSVGQVLTGSYLYIDANGDSEGTSLFQWYSASSAGGTYTAIPGATASTYTVVSGDIGQYIKFQVTPVATVVPTTGSAALSSATAQVTAQSYIYEILSTGQSLSVGYNTGSALTTTQPYSNLMLSGATGGQGTSTSFIPLVEGTGVETPSSAIANTITANVPGNNYAVNMSLHGVSSLGYAALAKGTAPYTNGMTQVANSFNAANLLGRISRVIGITAIHGETDNYNYVNSNPGALTPAQYEAALVQWQSDYETDAKAITGQSGTIPLFIDQLSSFTSTFINRATSDYPIYQLKASTDNPTKIFMVTPKYFFNYSDVHHLTAASSRWLGEYYGKVIKLVAVDNVAWRPLSPDTTVINGNVIYAKFHVPAGNLAFDTTLMPARTNYGFEYFDSTSSATISSVEIITADTVKVTLSGTPSGSNKRLRYAYTGIAGSNPGPANAPGSIGGNLRDTDPYPSLYGNTLYNWSVQFDQALTADTTPPSTPVASPVAGAYTSTQSVTLTAAGSDYIKYSTTSTPADCLSGTTYTGAISVAASSTIYVRACDIAQNSSTASFAYVIDSSAPSTPVASPIAGTYATTQSVTLSAADSDNIQYSTVSTPADCVSGTTYTGAISVSTSQTIYVRACDNALNSSTASFAYVIDSTPPSTPVASPVAGTYTSTQTVTLSAAGSDNIQYSTTSTPADCLSGTTYTGAITVAASETIYVRACDTALNSSTASFAYVIDSAVVSAPGGGSGAVHIALVDARGNFGSSLGFSVLKRAGSVLTLLLSADPATVSGYAIGTKPDLSDSKGISTYVGPEVTYTLTNPQASALYLRYYSTTGNLSEVISRPLGGASLPAFTATLKPYSKGAAVKMLQQFLNTHGFTIAKTGPGSPGNETTFYGNATIAAIRRFQEANPKTILIPNGLLKGTGIFGSSTMKVVNEIIAGER